MTIIEQHLQRLEQKLDALRDLFIQGTREVLRKENTIMGRMEDTDAAIAATAAQVERLTTVDASVEKLLNDFSDQLAAALAAAKTAGATDAQLAQMTALNATLSSKTDELVAAVVAKTPAAPPA